MYWRRKCYMKDRWNEELLSWFFFSQFVEIYLSANHCLGGLSKPVIKLICCCCFPTWFAISGEIAASWALSWVKSLLLSVALPCWHFDDTLTHSDSPVSESRTEMQLPTCSGGRSTHWGVNASCLAVGWTCSSKYKHSFSSNLTCSWKFY